MTKADSTCRQRGGGNRWRPMEMTTIRFQGEAVVAARRGRRRELGGSRFEKVDGDGKLMTVMWWKGGEPRHFGRETMIQIREEGGGWVGKEEGCFSNLRYN